MAIHEFEPGLEAPRLELLQGEYTAEQAEPRVAYYMRLALEGLHAVALNSKDIRIDEASIGRDIAQTNAADLERLRTRGKR